MSENIVLLRPMRKMLALLLLSFVLVSVACKSNYEKIRTSNDPELIITKAFELYDKEDYQRAQTLFDLVLTSLRGDPRAEKAYFCYAYTHYHLKNYLLGAYYFKTFSNTFVNSSLREEAAFMSAYANYQLSPSYRLDQGSTREAIEEFQLFVNLFPNSARIEECNRLIDELRRKQEQKAFAEGQLYYNLRQYQSAVISFDNLLKDYPESPEAERVRFLIAKAEFLLAENSIIEKKELRYRETITRCNDFLEKYSQGKYAKEITSLRSSAESALMAVRKKLKST